MKSFGEQNKSRREKCQTIQPILGATIKTFDSCVALETSDLKGCLIDLPQILGELFIIGFLCENRERLLLV